MRSPSGGRSPGGGSPWVWVGVAIASFSITAVDWSAWLNPQPIAPTAAEVGLVPPPPRPEQDAEFFERNFIAAAVLRVQPGVVGVERLPVNHGSRLFANPPGGSEVRSLGAGFVWDEAGHVVTSAAVVRRGEPVRVIRAEGGEPLAAQVVGTDSLTGVAVVRVTGITMPVRLPAVPLGQSDRLQVGDWAIAIGNPLGLSGTVTAGIISATGQPHPAAELSDQDRSLIQTDAAVSAGNAGGPLLDAAGQVVGMTTQLPDNGAGNGAAADEALMDVGFAVPIERVRAIVEQIIRTGQAEHPYLGVAIAPLTQAWGDRLAQRFAWPPEQWAIAPGETGVWITEVQTESPAALAGLQPGDRVVAVDGVAIATPVQLQTQIIQGQVGQTLTLQVARAGQLTEVPVTLVALPLNAN